jgi:hypothetical protein
MIRFTATLLAAAAVAQWIFSWLGEISQASIIINVFMLGMTWLVYRMVAGISDRRRFTQVYLATIVVKMLATCSLMIVLIFLDKPHARSNVIFLLVLYAIFTAIEVGFLIRAARAKQP